MGLDLSKLLSTTSQSVYEYRDIWSEEAGVLNADNSQWSYGNGSTGFIGLPIDSGWEVVAMYFHADTYPATGSVVIDLMDYGLDPSNATANTIATISVTSATDGGGNTNNAFKYQVYTDPIAIPTVAEVTQVGFITRTLSGAISDARVGARLRRKVGDFITDITFN